jgi:DNA-binding transcriptional LysR family regulator
MDRTIDFGFVNADAAEQVQTHFLYTDEMMAVLPMGHPLAEKNELTLQQLAEERLILLDEGEQSVTLDAFEKLSLMPKIAYEVYDDYSILAMVRQNLGVSIMYQKVLEGFERDIEIRPIVNAPRRNVALAWKSFGTMPYASQKFAEHVIKGTTTGK